VPNYKSFLVTELKKNMSVDGRDFNYIETRDVITFSSCKARR